MKVIGFTLITATTLLVAVSCKKDNENEEAETPNNSTIVDNSKIENAYNEMSNISDQAITGELVFYKSGKVTFADGKEEAFEKTPCNVIITIDTTSSPKSVTVDWGNTNCDCNDGKQRRGKIVTTFTGSYFAQGTVITHTPVDYFVNDMKIDGTMTVENMGNNASGQPYYNVNIDGTVTKPDNVVIDYTSSRVRTFVLGYDTPLNFWDDQYDITGNANASYSTGGGYTAEVTSPIRIKIGCGFPTQGKLSFTPTGLSTRYIDYGNGTCDYTFTVTVDGITYTIN